MFTPDLTAISAYAGNHKVTDIADIAVDLRAVVLCVIAGFAAALIIMYYCKAIAGKAVRLLLEAKAFSEQSAKSLEELGIKNVKYHARMLEKSNPQRTICEKAEDGRYFIKEEYRDRAERTYATKENMLGMTAVSLVITAILFFGVFFWSDSIVERIKRSVNEANKPDFGGQTTDDGGYVYETDEMGHVKDGSEEEKDGDGEDKEDEEDKEDKTENTAEEE